MTSKIEWFGAGSISERLKFFWACLSVKNIHVQFNKTDNTAACKTLLDLLLRFGQMPNESRSQKNNEKSKMLRMEGNKIFGKKEKLSDALDLYNQAICWAEEGTELATGFANRSAVYFQWELYDACIANINLAVEAGCPETILAKLVSRRADCLTQMQKVPAEFHVVQPVTLHLQCKVIENRREFQNSRYAFDIDQKRSEPKLSMQPNERIPFIANCIQTKSNAKQGRYVVTTEDLKPGQIISIEPPYTNSLTKYYRYRKCSNCLKDTSATLIPCPSCTCTMFCSKECLAEARTGFHSYECPVADYIWTHCEEYALTLRMVVKAFTTFDSIEELIEVRAKKSNETAFSSDHTNNDVNDKLRYEWVNNLVTNEENRIEADLFDRCCKVAILYHHLIEKTRFGEMLRTQQERDTLMSVILQHTQVTSINCFNCYEYDDLDINAFMELKPLDVFSRGMYPLSSLFNHSCAPNVATISSGTKLVTYVTRPIKRNDEITVCYKRYSHFEYGKKDRIENLSIMYGFNCDCAACRYDYPMWHEEARMPVGNRTARMGFFSGTFLSDLNMEHGYIAEFCSILHENADLYPCRSLFHIGLKLQRALTLEFGNISTELQVILNENSAQIAKGWDALARVARSRV